MRVDLVFSGDCEEAFDLALYQNRAVELIAWDDQPDSCDNRLVTIRYLSH